MMNRNEFFQAMPITRLNIRLTTASLEVCTDDIDDIHVMVSGSKDAADQLRITAASDTLRLEQPRQPHPAKGSWLEVTIRLPRSWKGAINARTIYGWMNIRSIAGTDLALYSVSGTIMANDLHFMTIAGHTFSGAVKLQQILCKQAKLTSVRGSLTIADAQLQKAHAFSITSTIALSLLAPFEALTLGSITGDLCIDAPINLCDAVLKSLSGRIRTTGVTVVEGGPKVRAATISSTLDISTTLE